MIYIFHIILFLFNSTDISLFSLFSGMNKFHSKAGKDFLGARLKRQEDREVCVCVCVCECVCVDSIRMSVCLRV